jgi:hypothetical protein
MRKELTISELDDQRVELLPARETLHFHSKCGCCCSSIWASNSALAFNVNSYYADATAVAVQNVG